MYSTSSCARWRRGGLVLVGIAFVLSACGDAELAKRTFERSTVPLEPAQGRGEVPEGEIDDAAVSMRQLRLVDPCGVLGNGTLEQLGEPENLSSRSWAECVGDVTAPGDEPMQVRLEVGADLGSAEEPSGQLTGLPLAVNERDDGNCVVSVTTSKDAAVGITATVDYDAGQPCRSGKVVLAETLQRLHDDPPTLPDDSASLLRVDPCSVVDGAELSEVIDDEPEGVPSSVYGCAWEAEQPRVSVRFRDGVEPTVPGDQEEVELGSGVTGRAGQTVDSIDTCEVGWVHREQGDNDAELVMVKYEHYTGDPESDKPCDKAETVAKSVVDELPTVD